MLRDYQQEVLDRAGNELRHYKGVVIVLPCRSGKSYVMEEICNRCQKKGSNVLILAHRNILLEQHRQLIDYPNVRIESVFTEVNHLGEHGKVDLIMIDEAHISGCKTYHDVCEYYNCKILGFTASPARLDGKPLDLFQKIVEGISADELIKRGAISDYDLYAPKLNIDLSKVPVGDGDYSVVQLEDIMCDRKIYGDIIENYEKLAKGKQAIAYCTSIKHSKIICDLFNGAGYTAVHIDSHTPERERLQVMDDFKHGKITILCNCNLISEGITLPSCEVCLMLRPTQSLALYIQQSCRALTPQEGKKAIIIDYVGNAYRHGMPTEKFEWSLTERKKCRNSSGEPEVLVRQCKKCLRVYAGTSPICPYCGAENGKTKKQIEQEEKAELERVTAIEKKAKRMEVGMQDTFGGLIEIAKRRGYAPGWCIAAAKAKGICVDWSLYNKFKRERGN